MSNFYSLLFFFLIGISFKNLVEVSILGNQAIILMPSDFNLMPEELLQIKYPSNRRPSEVYTNEDGTINLAVNHLPNQISSEQLPQLLPLYVQQFGQVHPQIEWYKKEMVTINGKKFILLEFVTSAVDTKIYNQMLVTEFKGRMFMCSFNCTQSQEEEWRPLANKMMTSLKLK